MKILIRIHFFNILFFIPKVDDDIVTLGEMTEYPILQWKFPQITHCPRMNCKRKFPNRDAAIDHYRAMHAKYDILCQECDLIISVSGAHNLMNHYKRKHPDIEPPAKRPENRVICFYLMSVNFKLTNFGISFSIDHMSSVWKGVVVSSTTHSYGTEAQKQPDRFRKNGNRNY